MKTCRRRLRYKFKLVHNMLHKACEMAQPTLPLPVPATRTAREKQNLALDAVTAAIFLFQGFAHVLLGGHT